MTHSHVDTVALAVSARRRKKPFCCANLTSRWSLTKRTSAIPIGSSYEIYVECRNQIEQGIASLLKFMEQHEISCRQPSGPKTAGFVNFALGADHGGFELKEALKEYLLRERG